MEEYSIKDVTNTFGLSRSTILYYEKLGIICSKKNPNNGYRIYSHDEINRLKECVCLKNMGYSIKEVSEMLQDPNRNDQIHIEAHIEKLTRQIEFQKCYVDQLNELMELSKKTLNQIEIVDMPKYYYLHSGCETGYHQINQSSESNLLIQNLPLSSFLTVQLNFFEQNSSQRIVGRSILEKHIPLLFGLYSTIDWNIVGGCRALRMVVKSSPVITEDIKNALASYAKDHHLKLCSSAYISYLFPNFTESLSEIYIPIIE